jgi:3-hydroxy-9,10-secoandrosta-1,3,5(10)-triene-9,17-dione monooxygenase reductase component
MCQLMRKPLNSHELRKTLGTYTTGVAIVTAALDNHLPVGMTINSFCSVSLEPALVAWSIGRSAASFKAFARCNAFTISVLTSSQAILAKRFATRGADKFAGIEYGDPAGPVIPDAGAWLRCSLYRQVSLGDHLMLVGQVEEFERQDARPLVFSCGQFGEFDATADNPGLSQRRAV